MSAMPRFAMTYVVYWPASRVLKVGRAWKWSRVEKLSRAGAHVIVCARGTDASWEREALRALARWFPRAFTGWDDAEAVLGRGGKGWTECFTVHEHDMQFALDKCIEGFARGNDQGVNEATNDQRGRPGAPRRGAARGEADGAVAVAEP